MPLAPDNKCSNIGSIKFLKNPYDSCPWKICARHNRINRDCSFKLFHAHDLLARRRRSYGIASISTKKLITSTLNLGRVSQ